MTDSSDPQIPIYLPFLNKTTPIFLAGTIAIWNVDYISQPLLQLSETKFYSRGWEQKWQTQFMMGILKGKEHWHSSCFPLSCLLVLQHPFWITGWVWDGEELMAKLRGGRNPEIWFHIALPLLSIANLHSFMWKKSKPLSNLSHCYFGFLSLQANLILTT